MLTTLTLLCLNRIWRDAASKLGLGQEMALMKQVILLSFLV